MKLLFVIHLPSLEKFPVNVSLKDILKVSCRYWN